MAWLQSVDATLFYWINTGASNPVFDWLLPLLREKWFWAPLYLFVAAFAVLNLGRQRGIILVLGLVASAGLADFTSSTLIKKNVERLRPCNDPAMQAIVVRRVSCGSGYSFTSSHAANHFAAAVFLGMALGGRMPKVRAALLAWAASIAVAQVYVGVHYPGDVLAGALLGALLGWWVATTFRLARWLPWPVFKHIDT